MNETNCENWLMQKMAEDDGEDFFSSLEKSDRHLSDCENCRREIEQMRSLDNLLNRQARCERQADLWSAIEKRIEKPAVAPIGWKPFALLGVLLIACKLLEMLPARDFGLPFKLVPLIIVGALFIFIRENPFKIKTEFVLEN